MQHTRVADSYYADALVKLIQHRNNLFQRKPRITTIAIGYKVKT